MKWLKESMCWRIKPRTWTRGGVRQRLPCSNSAGASHQQYLEKRWQQLPFLLQLFYRAHRVRVCRHWHIVGRAGRHVHIKGGVRAGDLCRGRWAHMCRIGHSCRGGSGVPIAAGRSSTHGAIPSWGGCYHRCCSLGAIARSWWSSSSCGCTSRRGLRFARPLGVGPASHGALHTTQPVRDESCSLAPRASAGNHAHTEAPMEQRVPVWAWRQGWSVKHHHHIFKCTPAGFRPRRRGLGLRTTDHC